MELYFSPLACSLAARIIMNETGVECDYRQVDLKAKKVDGKDYLAINPLGQVPVLRTAEGELLTENAAILQYVARWSGRSDLAPAEDPALAKLQQWLSFISAELHAGVFSPLFTPSADDAVKAFALEKAKSRLAYLNERLSGRDTLLDAFSIADAYLFTVLNWTQATPIRLEEFKGANLYHKTLAQRPSIARALAVEFPLYRAA